MRNEDKNFFSISTDQERLWSLHYLYSKSAFLNCAMTARLTGKIDIKVLDQCINNIVIRQDVLRSKFLVINDKPCCVLEDFKESYLIFKALDSIGGKEHIDHYVKEEIAKPFSLKEGSLFKVILVECAPSEYILLLVIHHIIADIKTLELFLYELMVNYENAFEKKEQKLTVLPVQYYDFIKKLEQVDEDFLIESREFWLNRLKNISPLTNLSMSARPVRQKEYAAEKYVFKTPVEFTQKILEWCKDNAISPNTLFLTAFQIVIAHISEQYHYLIGVAIDNRIKAVNSELMGYFAIPTLFCANVLPGLSFLETAQQTQQEIQTMLFYREFPLTELTAFLRSRWSKTNLPFLQLMFSYVGQLAVHQSSKHFDVEITNIERAGTDFDLFLTVILDDKNFIVGLQYNSSLFQAEVVEEMAKLFEKVLLKMITEPSLTIEQFSGSLASEKQQTEINSLLPIAASFTVEPLESAMNFWLSKLKLPLKQSILPYSQLLEHLVNPKSLFFCNASKYNVILFRFEDIFRYNNKQNHTTAVNNYLNELIAAIRKAAEYPKKNFLLGICPASTVILSAHKLIAYEEKLINALSDLKNIKIIKMSEWQEHYPLLDIFDNESEKLGHIPYRAEFYTVMATLIARKIHSHYAPVMKVIAIDCDNTLWGGIVGENGIKGISLTAAHLFLQNFLIKQQESGMLLCLCSKNNESDVVEVFANRPDMQLKLSHIAAFRINWDQKSKNLKALASELNIGLDAFIFIDDSITECAEVRLNCPEVLTLQLPNQEKDIPIFLRNMWIFDQCAVTSEDQSRTMLYQQNRLREQHKTHLNDYQSFIESLAIQMQFIPLNPENIARAVQLLQRTNQFNTTTERWALDDINNLCVDGNSKGWLVDVSDRFGHYGLVGFMLTQVENLTLKVLSFLLSCRALNRGIEHKMLAYLGDYAKREKISDLHIFYRDSSRNKPAHIFLEDISLKNKIYNKDSTNYILSAEQAKAIKFDPVNCQNKINDVASVKSSDKNVWHVSSLIYEDIANHLGCSKEIHALIFQSKLSQEKISNDNTSPSTPNEKLLLTIWQEVLAREAIGIHQDFFLLGGNSVQYVQVISKALSLFKVDISFDKFLENSTINSMATLIDECYFSTKNPNKKEDRLDQFKKDIYLYEVENCRATSMSSNIDKPKNILLTGGTGFLGAYLLRDLLLKTDATIYCLVRASNVAQAMARIYDNLVGYGVWQEKFQSRIKPIVGDLAESFFGLSDKTYQDLAQTIEVIFHNGALVNFMYPYEAVKTANVDSAREIIRLASSYILKPIHFISSIGVLDSNEVLDIEHVTENHVLEFPSQLSTGYFQSKWVAEQLMILARRQGIPVSIYRPGNITGDSKTGAGAEDDLIARVIRASFEYGIFPDIEVELVPVDYVSSSIIAIGLNRLFLNQNFHIVNNNRLLVSEYILWAKSKNLKLKLFPLEIWIEKIINFVASNQQHLLYPFLPILQNKSFLNAITHRPIFDASNALNALSGTNISCPILEGSFFETYTQFFMGKKQSVLV